MINIRKLFKQIDATSNEFYVFNAQTEKVESVSHQHTKTQLLYAEGGIVHVLTSDAHWYLPARCFMIIPANTEHSLLSFSSGIQLYNYYFDVKEEDGDYFDKQNIYFANDMIREMFLFSKNWEGSIKTGTPSYYFLKGMKSVLPMVNSPILPFPIQHPSPKDETLIAIARFLMRNLERNYTLEEIAVEFGMSARTLSRKFKTHMGLSYVRFLRSLRITKALELIAEDKYNMYEVAMLVGYGSLSTFSNIFYKVLQMRPTDYQAYIRGNNGTNEKE